MTESVASTKKFPLSIILIIAAVVIAVGAWIIFKPEPIVTPEPVKTVVKKVSAPAKIIEPLSVIDDPAITETTVIEDPLVAEKPLVKKPTLPALDDSDTWLQEKLTQMTWRKELLKLIIDEDMIRRFVVFTDNFAQGQLAYEHSPFVQPMVAFSAIETDKFSKENGRVWQWNEKTTRRFSLYVDLLRSFDSENLVAWYMELKPLIDQAYAELGYEDSDFTETLQQAITRVLDMEIPKETLKVVRPSVMYKFKDPRIEALDDSDKLLLRLGKENLLVIKSVLLEISDKLARQSAKK